MCQHLPEGCLVAALVLKRVKVPIAQQDDDGPIGHGIDVNKDLGRHLVRLFVPAVVRHVDRCYKIVQTPHFQFDPQNVRVEAPQPRLPLGCLFQEGVTISMTPLLPSSLGLL